MIHRGLCLEMEHQRFMDIGQGLETQSIDDYGGLQQKKRKSVTEKIEMLSTKCRDNIKDGINKVLSELRNRIISEMALDEEQKKNNPI